MGKSVKRFVPDAVARLFAGVTAPVLLCGIDEACRRSADHVDAPAEGCVLAPTEMTCLPAAGLPVVPSPGPELPEEATTVAPVRAALLHATAVGLSGPPEPPKLKLMTCA